MRFAACVFALLTQVSCTTKIQGALDGAIDGSSERDGSPISDAQHSVDANGSTDAGVDATATPDAAPVPTGPQGALIALVGDETWRFANAEWTKLNVAGPPPRNARTTKLAYDAYRRRVVLYGGSWTQDYFDTWQFDDTSWMQIATPNTPTASRFFGLAYDPIREHTVLLGGQRDGMDAIQEMWTFDGADWSLRNNVNAPRWYTPLAWDYQRQAMLGQDFFSSSSYAYDGTTWASTDQPVTPVPHGYYCLAYDPTRQAIVLFGGLDFAQVAYSETWLFQSNAWQQLTTVGTPPARADAGMAFHAPSGQLVLAGGYNGMTNYADTWVLEGNVWSSVPVASAPVGTLLLTATDF